MPGREGTKRSAAVGRSARQPSARVKSQLGEGEASQTHYVLVVARELAGQPPDLSLLASGD